MPLNELKFLLVNAATRGLKAYFSPEKRALRAQRAAHNEAMQNDPDYAFEFLRSKLRGEVDYVAAWEGATPSDVAEAQRADDDYAKREEHAR